MARKLVLAAAAVLALVPGQPALALSPPSAPGCPVFPASNVWHKDVSRLPVARRSATWISNMGGTARRLHPDFGPSGAAMPYGIPWIAVAGTHSKMRFTFDYADESNNVGYPIDARTPVESGSDAHAIVVDRDHCVLYEVYATDVAHRRAGSGAVWNLKSNALRPAGWTSADAAGLPIFPGLVRLDEVRRGVVDHAIRFTAQRTDRRYVWPARHQAGAARSDALPPMGARFRLRASFSISRYRADTRAILTAMKRYGMILADNGSNWFFQGTAENGWSTAMLDELKSIPARAFEAVDESGLMIASNSGAAR
jgi:hypothetical protein